MFCKKCSSRLTKAEFNFSVKHFGKVLCKPCQKDLLYLKQKHARIKNRSTAEAQKLHAILVKNGFEAQLEKWDGHKHIDIALPKYKVNIEVDGKHHMSRKQALADLKRTYHSFMKGYITFRIPNVLVREDPYETAHYLMALLKESEAQLDKDVENEDAINL